MYNLTELVRNYIILSKNSHKTLFFFIFEGQQFGTGRWDNNTRSLRSFSPTLTPSSSKHTQKQQCDDPVEARSYLDSMLHNLV